MNDTIDTGHCVCKRGPLREVCNLNKVEPICLGATSLPHLFCLLHISSRPSDPTASREEDVDDMGADKTSSASNQDVRLIGTHLASFEGSNWL
jgi:hypothetical protein